MKIVKNPSLALLHIYNVQTKGMHYKTTVKPALKAEGYTSLATHIIAKSQFRDKNDTLYWNDQRVILSCTQMFKIQLSKYFLEFSSNINYTFCPQEIISNLVSSERFLYPLV